VHTKAAKAAGASREEAVESSMLAAALRAGGSGNARRHGPEVLRLTLISRPLVGRTQAIGALRCDLLVFGGYSIEGQNPSPGLLCFLCTTQARPP
jgi:hypothetical protein